MSDPRLVLCGGVSVKEDSPIRKNRRVLELTTHGSRKNVHVKLEDVAKVFLQHLRPRLADLLEIAAYVYAADTAVPRGTGWSRASGLESWRRNLRFVVPVSDLQFWDESEVKSLLVDILSFLTDDTVEFEFCQMTHDRPLQGYIDFAESEDWPFYHVDRVIMFSGGLDSLAGTVETASAGKNLVLVSHRPVSTLDRRQRELFEELKKKFDVPMLRVPVWINKESKKLRGEYTQRTRSFLYSALGVIVGESVRADGVQFYENGVVSLNFPVADEVLGARASRTTHPWVLKLFSDFYSLVAGRRIEVDNPYLFMTKADIVSRIAKCGVGDLIPRTCSCWHTFFKPKNQWHCGKCSQCIDRRVAILAAGLEAHDPEIDYESDVFVGPRKEGHEQNMAVHYARHAIELSGMSDNELGARFNAEIMRAVRGLPKARDTAESIVQMHKRYGEYVKHVLNTQIQIHSEDLLTGSLDRTSMLAMITGQKHLESSWVRCADRIHNVLADGLPAMCKATKPKDEPQLQEWCDGILKSNRMGLEREFPFMKWASASTKPDWSNEQLCLWVELKYVRKKTRPSKISDQIAADITKYGDAGRRVIFIIYDPEHKLDENRFQNDVECHEGMMVRFIR